MDLAHSLLNNKLYTSEHVVLNCTSVLLYALEPRLSACISEGIDLTCSDEVYVVNTLLIGHYRFQLGCCAVFRSEEGLSVFGEVTVTAAVDSNIYLSVIK